MSNYLEMEIYRRAYLPICACNSVIGWCSAMHTLWIFSTVYLRGYAVLDMPRLLVVLVFLCCAGVFHCNFMITGGRAIWLKASVGILLISLVTAITAMLYQPNWLMHTLVACSSLLGLMIFNSKRHRQFYSRFRAFRCQRAMERTYQMRRK